MGSSTLGVLAQFLHTWHHPDCELVDITLHGAPPPPGDPGDVPEMPAFEDELTEEDVEAILDYIKTWWTEEQREFQADVTERALLTSPSGFVGSHGSHGEARASHHVPVPSPGADDAEPMVTVAILYEHPEWFRPLFAALDRRGVDHEPVDMTSHRYDPTGRDGAHRLVVNRMSPSAWTRGNGHAIGNTLNYLEHLEALGVPIVNGVEAFRNELSKAAQLRILDRVGVRYPRAVAINHPEQAPKAAIGLDLPVLVKPNVGGSGAGIRSFTTQSELEDAVGELDLGPDGTGLVQEHLPARGARIVRVEIVGGRLVYAIRLLLEPGTFNLCPADYCRVPDAGTEAAAPADPLADGVSGRGRPIEAYDPPPGVVRQVEAIVAAAGMEVGGVEYLVNDRDGEPHFYDINALSNFVADADRILGFDPYDVLAAHIAARLPA